MSKARLGGVLLLFFVFIVSVVQIVARRWQAVHTSDARPTRVYWFIPDGLRAEPDVFKIYEWAREGHLPHIRHLMENGTYGYSVPVFPGHTPSNFATLFTGTFPNEHGVSDGPLRSQGYPLKIIPRSGFSSTAKEKDPIWYTLEKRGLVSSLLTIPGSTPPETSSGNIVRGRWGGWGVEFPSVVVHSALDRELRNVLGRNERTFNNGKRLTFFVSPSKARGWASEVAMGFSSPQEVKFENWGVTLYFLLIDTKDDGRGEFTEVLVSRDKKNIDARLKEGEWSGWLNVDLFYPIQKNYQDEAPQRSEWEQKLTGLTMASHLKLQAVQVGSEKNFRFRVLYDALNESLAFPASLSRELIDRAGPMVDFPDDFPPQLIYVANDKKTFLDESRFSFEWHEKALDFLLSEKSQDLVIHNIYTPNQMLTSRWWMAGADPSSERWAGSSGQEKENAWRDILDMYKKVDAMLGLAMKRLGPEAYIVFGSDHGIAPLNIEVRLNNLFAKKGWLKFRKEKGTGALLVDWKRTRVVFLQSNHVYIRTDDLDRPYFPQTDSAYENFRDQVIQEISKITVDGVNPFDHVYRREEAAQRLHLPESHIGDVVLVHKLGYCAVEDMTEDGENFSKPLKAGYKQGLDPASTKSLWTPFMIMGPGVKKGYALKGPISHLDQYPIVMRILKEPTELRVQSRELDEAVAK